MTNGQKDLTTATITTPTDREIHVERIFEGPARPRVRGLHRS